MQCMVNRQSLLPFHEAEQRIDEAEQKFIQLLAAIQQKAPFLLPGFMDDGQTGWMGSNKGGMAWQAARGLGRRAQGMDVSMDELTTMIDTLSPSPEEGRGRSRSPRKEAADLVAFSLAIADGLTEADIRLHDPDLYRRVQAHALAQAEITRDRLNQLLHRPATRARPLSAVSPGERAGTGPIPPLTAPPGHTRRAAEAL